jgi:hypothetical protein
MAALAFRFPQTQKAEKPMRSETSVNGEANRSAASEWQTDLSIVFNALLPIVPFASAWWRLHDETAA